MKLTTHNIEIYFSASEDNSEHCMNSKLPVFFQSQQTRTYVFILLNDVVDARANSTVQTVWELWYRIELASCSIVLEKLLVAQLIKNSPNSAKCEG
jgi:hypothetical protein